MPRCMCVRPFAKSVIAHHSAGAQSFVIYPSVLSHRRSSFFRGVSRITVASFWLRTQVAIAYVHENRIAVGASGWRLPQSATAILVPPSSCISGSGFGFFFFSKHDFEGIHDSKDYGSITPSLQYIVGVV